MSKRSCFNLKVHNLFTHPLEYPTEISTKSYTKYKLWSFLTVNKLRLLNTAKSVNRGEKSCMTYAVIVVATTTATSRPAHPHLHYPTVYTHRAMRCYPGASWMGNQKPSSIYGIEWIQNEMELIKHENCEQYCYTFTRTTKVNMMVIIAICVCVV